ncbi:chromosome transmission fidelity protein 18 homolog [Patiria miniata]|uniref:AAA+ ATPase domain-containing protein n=1 Tax=Patiria miniata TaxID=46514 RepID=A0A914APJ1_PATMI|nr:chromosome transmission fidelity protein 18 homolog [Patiria miniata]
MEEDFEDRYADELDAMREMEMDFEASQRSQSQNRVAPSQTGKPSHAPLTNGSQNLSITKSTATTGGLSQPKSQSDPLAALNTDGKSASASSGLQNGFSREPEVDGPERKAKKRDIEEMFGPLSDSEDELVIDAALPTIAPTAKRPRKLFPDASKTTEKAPTSPPPSPTPEEKALAKIMLHRQQSASLAQQPAEPTRTLSTNSGQDTAWPAGYRRLQILQREPPGLSARITGQDGRRVYLRMKEVVGVEGKMKNKSIFKQTPGHPLRLLAVPVEMMQDDLESERHMRLVKQAQTISASLNGGLSKKLGTSAGDEADDEMEDEDDTGKEAATKEKSSALWVDQYAPRRYTDLLSDDGINRNLLFWLKLWDHLVFGKEKKQRKKPKLEQQQKQAEAKNLKFKNKFQQEEQQEELDENNRPVHKIALLCGPPGLGKTTLAHIIAGHAGYNVVEMNASDDRSVEVFRNKLESSTQMQSVLVMDRRPNCLVIDEIDGAPTPAINCLLAFIKGASDNKTPTEAGPATAKKTKSKNLLRPIICICNDPYVPALRLLRQQAFVTHFPPTLSTRLAARLNEIARNNALRTDMTALMALCGKADNDIRSCLNTLQFIHGQGRVLSLALVQSLSVGQKDRHKGFFSIWQDIFKLPQPKRKQYANPHDVAAGKAKIATAADGTLGLDTNNPTSTTARFYNVVQLAQGAGDYDKLMQGIFENYLEMKFKDPRLEALNLASDWLIFHDRLGSVVARSQNYTFYRYLPYVPVVFHLLFASSLQPRLKYPNTAYENSVKQTRTQNLLSTVLSEVSPSTACFLDPRMAVTQILPLLLIILQPTFRPVNTQLFNAQEKRQMKELINSMIAYNLTYNQERSAEGQYNYVLDPNLDSVVRFSSTPPTKQMTYAAKQLIAREITLEKMRRSEAAVGGKNRDMKKGSKPSAPAKKVGPSAQSKVPRHLEKLQPKKVQDEPEKPTRDFFGRIIKKKSPGPKLADTAASTDGVDANNDPGSSQNSKAEARREQQEQLAGKLWYKFNQGFTNAVRKTVRIQDLL